VTVSFPATTLTSSHSSFLFLTFLALGIFTPWGKKNNLYTNDLPSLYDAASSFMQMTSVALSKEKLLLKYIQQT